MTSYVPGQVQTGDLPFENEAQVPAAGAIPERPDRISVTSYHGQPFSRRKLFKPPSPSLKPGRYVNRSIDSAV